MKNELVELQLNKTSLEKNSKNLSLRAEQNAVNLRCLIPTFFAARLHKIQTSGVPLFAIQKDFTRVTLFTNHKKIRCAGKHTVPLIRRIYFAYINNRSCAFVLY
jgi:hypothetical protein